MNPHALNSLLSVWPRGGARNRTEFARLRRAAQALGISVDPCVSRDQFRRAACNIQHRWAARRVARRITQQVVHRSAQRHAARTAAVPWKYQRFLRPHQNIRQQAIKLQPGATIPVQFGGMETTMYVDTARRLTFRGKPWFIEMKIKLNTEHLPIILTRESKCDCLYCGTSPTGSEDSCRKCGAPLGSC